MRKAAMDSKRWLLGLCLVAAVGLPAGAAGAAARLTTAVGTTSGDQALDTRAGLEDGAGLETGDDGGCSLLVDEDALMEVCGNTSLRLERKDGKPDGTRVVKLDRGEIRMVVEPRLGEEKIEIHTPTAIATVLGTVLYIAVDANGVTTITSEVSRVLVKSADRTVKGQTTIEGGEQIVIRPGEAPPAQPKKVSRQKMAKLGGCMLNFHDVALRRDRTAANDAQLEATVADDIAVATLPQVSEAPAAGLQVATTVDQFPDPAADPPFPTGEEFPPIGAMVEGQ
ncbi:MAG: FecR domain-containing protein, partial [Planctomycetes bacterium]|nr:FecR domain-containing protein [Planctomycetota bacterium]